MSRIILIAAILGALLQVAAPMTAEADTASSAICVIGSLGGTLLCGGVYVIRQPGTREHGHGGAPKVAPQPSVPFVTVGAPGLCVAPGSGLPPNVNPYQPTPGLAACPLNFGPAPPATNPVDLAISFWRTIPLPVPRPQVPPGYAITGLPAYLVTDGSLHPRPYAENTPLGPLTIVAAGSYLVNWGDGTSPTWAGPFGREGEPYPGGNIAHTYDRTGVVTVTLDENWSATWTIGPFHGELPDLRTAATIPNFRVSQLQAVITG
jgi:hypothetical protein